MKTLQLLNIGSNILKKNKIASHILDSEIILSKILNTSRERLLINQSTVSSKNIVEFKNKIVRRSRSEPIAYIFKTKEFMGSNFFIDQKSLIPRPETELLIEPIMKIFKNKSLFFLEVGIGSGCIMLSLLNHLKYSKGIGIDVCKKTLKNSKINLKRFKLENKCKLFHKSVDELKNIKFDLVISNPPYIIKRNIKRLSNDIKRFEPSIALDGGNDGLDVIKKVIYKSNEVLKLNGILALEIGYGQYRSVKDLLIVNNFKEKLVIKDYENNIRCIFSTLLKK
tara:strand:- start:2054 stop:2896 length:843 start_codon:yes stop_codon:yes gene_type:complete